MILQHENIGQINIVENETNYFICANTKTRDELYYSILSCLNIKHDRELWGTISRLLENNYDDINHKVYNTIVIDKELDLEEDKDFKKYFNKCIVKRFEMNETNNELLANYIDIMQSFLSEISSEYKVNIENQETIGVDDFIKPLKLKYSNENGELNSFETIDFYLNLQLSENTKSNNIVIINSPEAYIGLRDIHRRKPSDSTTIIFTNSLATIIDVDLNNINFIDKNNNHIKLSDVYEELLQVSSNTDQKSFIISMYLNLLGIETFENQLELVKNMI